jgi:L-fuculose-phosphate aldolase
MYAAVTQSVHRLIDSFSRGTASKYSLIRQIALIGREEASRRELVYLGGLLHDKFFVSATDGNLSVRLNDDTFLATPTGMSKGMMRSKDMVLVDRAGAKLKGRREVSSEIGMHLMIYKERPDVHGIVHAHPYTATGFASAGIALNEPLCSEIVMTLGEVPLAPYGTTGTDEIGESLAPFIAKHNAVLMANHGVVAYGKTLLEAYQRMEAVEHFARIVLVTHQLGRKNLISDTDIEKLVLAKDRYCSALK